MDLLADASPAAGRLPGRWLEAVDRHGLAIFVLGGYAAEQIALLDRLLTSDGWLAFLSGRQIARHGLPHRDAWTVIAQGRVWIDQQWLAQLVLYEVERLGGIRSALVFGLGLAVGTLALAAILAVRRGAAPRALTWLLVASLVPYGRSADNLRAQSLCYPLFVVLLVLITREGGFAKTAFLTLPMLVLWANLHGSVVLAAFLVSGAAVLRRHELGTRRSVALAGLPWACALASPYGVDLPRYYTETIVNPAFARYVAEWQPTTLSVLDLFPFVLVFGFVFLLGTGRSGWSSTERLVLGVCGLLALLAVRNGVWLALAAVLLVAPALTRVQGQQDPTAFARRMNRALVALVAAAALAAIVGAGLRGESWYTAAYPARAADLVAADAGPNGLVYASEEYADWLLWARPQLAGRLALDARLELLGGQEIRAIFELESNEPTPPNLLRGYRVIVVDPSVAAGLRQLKPGFSVAYADRRVAVLTAGRGSGRDPGRRFAALAKRPSRARPLSVESERVDRLNRSKRSRPAASEHGMGG